MVHDECALVPLVFFLIYSTDVYAGPYSQGLSLAYGHRLSPSFQDRQIPLNQGIQFPPTNKTILLKSCKHTMPFTPFLRRGSGGPNPHFPRLNQLDLTHIFQVLHTPRSLDRPHASFRIIQRPQLRCALALIQDACTAKTMGFSLPPFFFLSPPVYSREFLSCSETMVDLWPCRSMLSHCLNLPPCLAS